MENQEPAPEGGRACQHCGGPIPAEKDARTKYCSQNCQVQAWRRRNPEKRAKQNKRSYDKIPDERKKEYREHNKTVRIQDVRRTMVNAARSRAKRAGLPFNITADDITIPATCPVLGIPIELGSIKHVDGSPSLDKIIPAMGYVKGNVEVISWRANALKRDATVQEMRALADYYEQKLSKNWMVPNE